jgi:5-methylcytosine-specific restriction endonuclease McrA
MLFAKQRSSKDKRQNKCKDCDKKYRQNHLEQQAAYMKQYAVINNLDFNRRGSEYRKRYPERQVAYVQKTNAMKAQRMPKWLNEVQLTEIKQFYKDAAYLTNYTKTPIQVDHIVPLRGKNVSGLHVPWNMQLLTADENNRKRNKF